MLTAEQIQDFETNGFLIVTGVFAKEEVERLKDHFMQMHAQGPIPGLFHPVSEQEAEGDILRMFPRIMHPHRVDELSMRYMLDPRIFSILTQLFGEEPLAAQSMLYFKPPGAKGQALHQDNFYLKIEPGTCIAAWTALDPSDEENGGLFLVPGSQNGEIQCPHEADPSQSFTKEEVDVPQGLQPVPAVLNAGDVLFFNGNVIHGSSPNVSKDRFRRSFICHYAGVSTLKASDWYKPMYYRDGTPVEIDTNPWGGPCGTEHEPAGAH